MEQGQKPRGYYQDEHGMHPFFGIVWHEIGEDGEPAFENSWENYGNPYETVAYGIGVDGGIHLKGRPNNGLPDVAIFTLPAGYRSNKTLYFVVLANDAFGQLCIEPDGTVKLVA